MRRSSSMAMVVLAIGLVGIVTLALVLTRLSKQLPDKQAPAPSAAKTHDEPGAALKPGLAERILPANALFAVVAPNVPQMIRDVEKTDLGAVRQDPAYAEYEKRIAALAAEMPPQPGDTTRESDIRNVLASLDKKILDNISGECGFALSMGFEGQRLTANSTFFAELKDPGTALQCILDFAKEFQLDAESSQEPGGMEVYSVQLDTKTYLYLTADERALYGFIGTDPIFLVDMLNRVREKKNTPDGLWSNRHYQRVRSKTPPGDGVLAFIDLPAAIILIESQLIQEPGMTSVSEHLNTLSIRGIGPAGAHITFDEGGLSTAMRLHFLDSSRGIPALLTSLPQRRPDRMLAAMPSGAMYCTALSLDPSLVWNKIKEMVAGVSVEAFMQMQQVLTQTKEMQGIDIEGGIISSLGDEFGFFVPTDDSGFPLVGMLRNLSDMLLVLELKDAERFTETINAAIDKSGIPNVITEFRGVEVRSAEAMLGPAEKFVSLFTDLKPSFGVIEDMMVVGMNPQSVKVFIRERLQKKPPITSNPLYQQAIARMPDEFTGVTFVDSAAYLRTAHDAVLPMMRMAFQMAGFSRQEAMNDLDLVNDSLPPRELVEKHLFPSIQVMRVSEEEIAIDSVSPVSLPYLSARAYYLKALRQVSKRQQRAEMKGAPGTGINQ